MTTIVIPDMERVASEHLRNDPDVADYVGRRVVAKTPGTQGEPWVRVQQLSANNDTNLVPDYVITFLLDFDCYAGGEGGHPEASGLGRATRAALMAMRGVQDDGTVVTAVRMTGHARVPDESLEPARERMIVSAAITAHGSPA